MIASETKLIRKCLVSNDSDTLTMQLFHLTLFLREQKHKIKKSIYYFVEQTFFCE